MGKRENKCCGCSSAENLRRFHVVPSEYKKLFPLNVKSHNSSDVILLCVDCLEDANYVNNVFKKKKEKEYGVSREDFVDHEKERLKITAQKYLKKLKNREIHPTTEEDLNVFFTNLVDIVGHVPTDTEIQKFGGT